MRPIVLLRRLVREGYSRPFLAIVAVACTIVAIPVRNALHTADAAPATSASCVSGAGYGGINSTTVSATRGADGCVVIKYVVSGVEHYETFNYTGSDQSWTVPTDVTTATFFVLGAGGGGVPLSGGGKGGGGGYAGGSYALTPGQVLTIIVGQGGGGELLTLRSGTGINGCYTGNIAYGGGGRGSSCYPGNGSATGASSGGGRSAIRLASGTEIVTAGGGAGGGWASNGGAGGGLTGVAGTDATGGTQSAGGTVANALATRGAQYLGGTGYHQGGGGGGGWYGGGGGYSVSGGGGGSSYVALLTNGTTGSGDGRTPGREFDNLGPTVSSSSACASGVGYGGQPASTTLAQAGHGCVTINYGSTYATFDYFGEDQTWLVPSGITSLTVHALGAGGGAGRYNGGGGGYATGTYTVSPGDSLTIVVGQGGARRPVERISSCWYTTLTYGGGGRGGSCYGGGNASEWYGSGGGRSAIRLATGTEIITAGGGGGGAYGQAGWPGGGTTGGGTTLGGTQTAGGRGGSSVNGLPGTAGTQFLGGNSKDEGGGGGGGYYGGGGGGDNLGGGGGSSYVSALTGGSTTAGSGRNPGLNPIVNTTAPTISGGAAIGATLTGTAGTWAVSGAQTWKWQYSADGSTYSDISGATSSTYPPTQTGYYRVVETHSNILNTVSATSTSIQVLAPVVVDCTPTSGTFTHCKRFNFYAANQTFTMPSDLPAGHTFQIELWGAGGGGVCCNYWSNDKGGGAGGYQKAAITLANANQTYTIVAGERGEPRDTSGGYGGGGAGGPSANASSNPGGSGGGYAGVFIGTDTSTPLLIAGGGGGASAGIEANAEAGGGGGSGSGSAGSNTVVAGRAGTTSAGGAPATNGATTSGVSCPVTATAGSQYQGGRGCGTTSAGTEGGGGGGGGYYGGGGGKDQTAGSTTQNGGGGGGSGYIHPTLATSVVSTVGGKGSVANLSGGRTSDQYVAGIGSGGNGYTGTLAAATGGHAMVVFQWAVPPTARADTARGAKGATITLNPTSNDVAYTGTTITAGSVRLCESTDTAPNCSQTSVTVAGEGTYSVNTTTGVVTFVGDASFVGTSSLTYIVSDGRGAKSSSTVSFTTLAPPTARADQVAGSKEDTLTISPLANDTTSGNVTLDSTTLKLCAVTTSAPYTSAKCTETSITISGEGTYAVSSGRVTFTPAAGFPYDGTRTLNYVVQDSNGQEGTSTLTFIALPPPAARAVADSETVNYATTASINPLDNDSAGTTPASYTTPGTVTLDSTTLRLCSTTQLPRSRPSTSQSCTTTSLTVTDEGTWTLDTSTSVVTFVPLSTFSGTATRVVYEVCNTISGTWAPATPNASCSSSTLEVTVRAPTAPSPSNDTGSASLAGSVSFDPLANDSASGKSASRLKLCSVDPAETAPNCESTSVTVANEGTWTLDTSTGAVTFTPLSSFTGSTTPVRYAATDAVGQEFDATMTATIAAPTAPSASNDSTSGTNDDDIVFSPLGNDTGTGLANSTLRLCASGESSPCTHITLTESGKGDWSVDTITGRVTFSPNSGFVGTAGPLTYSVKDAANQTASATLSITVTAVVSPNTPDLASASDSGSSSTDDTTYDTSPTISVSGATSGNTVAVTASKSGETDVSCTFVASASTTSCNLGTLAEGSWSVVSTQTTTTGATSSNSSPLTIVIDSTAPTITRFSTTTTNGTYGVGDTINITATVSEAIADGASITVTLDTGETVELTKATSATLTGTYTIGAGVSSSDLTVSSYALTSAPTDIAGNVMSSITVPSGVNNIAGSHAIVVDTSSPTTTTPTTTTTTPPTTTPPVASGTTTTTTTSTTTTSTIVPTGTTTTTAMRVTTTVRTPAATVLVTIAPTTVVTLLTTPIAPPTTTRATTPTPTTVPDRILPDRIPDPTPAEPSPSIPTTPPTTTRATTPTSSTVPDRVLPDRIPDPTPAATSAPVPTDAPPADAPSTTPAGPSPSAPNPLVPVVDATGLTTIQNGVGQVSGMSPNGWVKVEPRGSSSIVLTTSDGLRIEIAAKNAAGKPTNLNSRGMVVVEHDDDVFVGGEGLRPNSDASTWLFSTPRQLGVLKIDESGAFAASYKIGPDVAPGDHTAQINGIAPDGTLRSVEVAVEVVARRTPHVPSDNPPVSTDVIISALVLAAALSRRKDSDDGGSAEVAEVSVRFGAFTLEDRPDWFVPPSSTRLDDASREVPRRFHRPMPIVSRVLDDGAYLRALLGLYWLALPLIGLALGVVAARDTGFDVVTPSLAIVCVLVALGSFDALAGFVAAVAFAISCAVNGGVTSWISVRGILGITVLMFAVPLIASAIRPFRRATTPTLNAWKRSSDVTLLMLFGAWAAGTMFAALPALTGFSVEWSSHIDTVRWVTIVAIGLRYGLENLARIATARRLSFVQRTDLPEIPKVQIVVSSLVRAVVFAFVAYTFVGNTVALWIATILFVIPKLVTTVVDHFPNLSTIHRFLPRDILKTVVMLFVATWWSKVIADPTMSARETIEQTMIFAGLPGLAFGILAWFGRSGGNWPSTRATRVAGVLVTVLGVAIVLGFLW